MSNTRKSDSALRAKHEKMQQHISISQELWHRLNNEEGIAAAITTAQQVKDGQDIGDKLITVIINKSDEPRTKEILAELNIKAEIETI